MKSFDLVLGILKHRMKTIHSGVGRQLWCLSVDSNCWNNIHLPEPESENGGRKACCVEAMPPSEEGGKWLCYHKEAQASLEEPTQLVFMLLWPEPAPIIAHRCY